MNNHPRHLSAIADDEITALASLLSLPLRLLDAQTGTPSDLWLAAQARRAASLPRTLRRPHDWLARLRITAGRQLQQAGARAALLSPALQDLVPRCAVLCPAHEEMNPWIVRRVFFLVSKEATVGTDSLRKYLARPGRYHYFHERSERHGEEERQERRKKKKKGKLDADATGEMRALVDRLAGVVALWTDPAAVDRMRLGAAGAGHQASARVFPRIRSSCEACIVSAVGADAQVLCDLRAGLLGRSHKRRGDGSGDSKRRKSPVLLRLVDAWIDRLEGSARDELLRESKRLGKVVKRVRRAVRERRRQRKTKKGDDQGHSHGGKGVGSSGKQPSTSSSAHHTRRTGASVSSAAEPPKRHHDYRYHHGGSKGNNSRPADVDDGKSLPQNASSHHSNRDTIDDIIDAYNSRATSGAHLDHDGDQSEDCDDEDLDETDPRAAKRLQHTASKWYGAFSEAGEQHPAFRQSTADMESWWDSAEDHRSAGLDNRDTVIVDDDDAKPTPEMPLFADDEFDDDYLDPSQWTDISVATRATPSALSMSRGKLSPAPSMPRLPSLHRAPHVVSLVGSAADTNDDGYASSLYSQDETTIQSPTSSTASTTSRDSIFINPRAAPPAPSLLTPERDHGLARGLGATRCGRRCSSESTVLPGDSISAVGCRDGPDAWARMQERNDLDESFVRALRSGELERSRPPMADMSGSDDGSSDSDDDDYEEYEGSE